MRDDRGDVDPSRGKQRRRLLPGPEHLASGDPEDPGLLEDHLIVQVQRHRPVRESEQRHAPAPGQQPGALIDRRRVPRHLEHDLRAVAVRRVEHRLDRIVGLRIDQQVGTHLRRERPALVVGFDRDHLPGPERPRDPDREQADRSAPDDRDRVGEQVLAALGPERRMHGVPERFHHGRDVGVDPLADDPDVHRRAPRRTPRTRRRCRRRGSSGCGRCAPARSGRWSRRRTRCGSRRPRTHPAARDAPRVRPPRPSRPPRDRTSSARGSPGPVPTRSSRRCGGRSRRSRRRARARAPLPRPDRGSGRPRARRRDAVRSCAGRASCSA